MVKQERERERERESKRERWAWWCVPVDPGTLEAEAGESHEPGRWRLQ